jgi:two-component system sporulation sensor kinase A
MNDPLSNIRVLHVDDEEFQLKTALTLLKGIDPGINFTLAASPREAFEILKKSDFDCIVTDFKMEGMNGLDFAKEVRKSSNIPIILYTGRGGEEVAESAFLVGIDDYIRKEINVGHYQLLAKRIRDIVERRNTEEFYLKVVEEAKDGVSIVIDSKIIYANNALSQLLCYDSSKDLLGKNILELVPINDRNNMNERVIKRFDNGNLPPIFEFNVRRKDGSLITIETSSSLINHNGQKALLTFTRDVTERKQIENSLAKSEERFRSLMNLAPDGIVTMDMRGRIKYVNPSFLKLTGFEEKEVIGISFLKLKTLRIMDIPKYTKMFAEFLMGDGLLETPIEFRYQRKNGSKGWAEGHAKMVNLGASGKEILVIVRDITERKKLEEDLRVYSKELEGLAEEKSQKLIASEQLIVTGSIASSLGHDLRGPFNTIRNAVYLMQIRPEQTENMLKIIDNSVNTSIKLLDELRDRTKEFVLEMEDVEIVELIHEVQYENLVPPKIKLSINLDSIAVVHVDRGKMKRVFENLLRNAYEAMPDGGEISISVKEIKDGITIDITDEGTGIPDNVMRNLFKPFVTTKDNGTGLGLSFCKKTVDAHGGMISVKSEVGVGTTFSVFLNKVLHTEVANSSSPKLSG